MLKCGKPSERRRPGRRVTKDLSQYLIEFSEEVETLAKD